MYNATCLTILKQTRGIPASGVIAKVHWKRIDRECRSTKFESNMGQKKEQSARGWREGETGSQWHVNDIVPTQVRHFPVCFVAVLRSSFDCLTYLCCSVNSHLLWLCCAACPNRVLSIDLTRIFWMLIVLTCTLWIRQHYIILLSFDQTQWFVK